MVPADLAELLSLILNMHNFPINYRCSQGSEECSQMTQMERMVSKSEHTHVGSLGPQLPAILKAFQIINSVTFLYVIPYYV